MLQESLQLLTFSNFQWNFLHTGPSYSKLILYQSKCRACVHDTVSCLLGSIPQLSSQWRQQHLHEPLPNPPSLPSLPAPVSRISNPTPPPLTRPNAKSPPPFPLPQYPTAPKKNLSSSSSGHVILAPVLQAKSARVAVYLSAQNNQDGWVIIELMNRVMVSEGGREGS